ncbi:mediator of RNA polymerase II transcription subunit 13 [Scheffersomyces xylosifermentans]|uniref:mediator of RNA polymerase II transcription subunit 13 n=1 Tax=Scheffersomyces xylosifermentans TaxID=1304137 RepID=UPI00315CDF8A
MSEASASNISTHYYKLGHLSSITYYNYVSSTDNDQSLLELELQIRYSHPNILVTYYNKSLYYFTFGHNANTPEPVRDAVDLDTDSLEPVATNDKGETSQLDDSNTTSSADANRNGNDSENSSKTSPLDLAKEYPNLQLKKTNTVSVEMLANPPKSSGTSGSNNDDYLPFASLSLLKSIKKMILFNLSKNGTIKLFGNYCVVSNDSANHSILYLDPILLPNGDLLLSMILKEKISLLDSSVIDLKDELSPSPHDINFVIYLIPSGIRCHLFDPTSLVKNFIHKKSVENDNLINLIKLSTGVHYSFDSEEENLWIKLIPNLKHLNNQTSTISKFIHSVDNKKFILWPWKLCLLQFGKYEEVEESSTERTNTNSAYFGTSNPLDLISDLIDFNISSNQHHHQQHLTQSSNNYPFSIPSVMSSGGGAGIGSVDPSMSIDQHPHKDMGTMEINEMSTPMVPELFNLQNADTTEYFTKEEVEHIPQIDEEKKSVQSDQEDMEIDDLFGGSEDEEEEASNTSQNNKEQSSPKPEETLHKEIIAGMNGDNEVGGIENQGDISEQVINDGIDELFDIPNKDSEVESDKRSPAGLTNNVEKKQIEKSVSPEAMSTAAPSSVISKESRYTYLDIPKDQMTIKKSNSPDYNDPGAPLPIMPTPILPVPNSAYSTNPPTTAPIASDMSGYVDEQLLQTAPSQFSQSSQRGDQMSVHQKSIFSPILFNPIIKSNIDTKYGKGGKFYVEKEASLGPEVEKRKKAVRETSVSGFEIPLSKDNDQRKLASNLAKLNNSSHSLADSSVSSVSSEESDEDEEMPDEIGNSPPLKLNTVNDSFPNQVNSVNVPGFVSNYAGPVGNNGVGGVNNNLMGDNNMMTSFNENKQFSLSNFPTGGFGSPNSSVIGRFPNIKMESPFSSGDLQHTISPIDYDQANSQHTPSFPTSQPLQTSQSNNISGRTSSSEEASKSVSESSNYLPLILRSINVSTIPDVYLLNNLISNQLLPSFNINDDENDNDLEITKNNEMIIKIDHLDEFLDLVGPNLVFDMGLNKYKSNLTYYMDSSVKRKIEEIVSPFEDNIIDYRSPSNKFESNFLKIFPNSYKVNLIEFLNDQKDYESKDELENQLDFLDDITNDNEDILNPKSQYKKLKSIVWDALSQTTHNKENFEKYKLIVDKLNSNLVVSEDIYFKLPIIKTKVMKHNNIVNLNSLAINFWKYLNFSPINATKNFQVLLISENNGCGTSFLNEFLDLLTYNYNECNLGHISRVNLSTVETRPDLDNINNGILLMNKENGQTYNDTYSQVNKKLSSLVELIKLDLINKTNNFEFDRPLLLLFVNYNDNLNSTLQISKIFRNFKVNLTNHQLPLVSIFTKIIPGSLIVKNSHNQNRLKILSNFKLSKLSMNLYNQCPNGLVSKEITKNAYTQLVKEPPSKIHFKFMSTNFKDNNFNDDIFLHLAYERSIDRSWFSAAWSDPLGVVTYTKSWYCPNKTNLNASGIFGRDAHDIASVCDDIWNKSNELFKKLNDEINNKSSASGGKKFLVLTRINSIIPDDELVHWKRLSVKHKDISLIVLSVSHAPKLVFEDRTPKSEATSDTATEIPNLMAQSQQMMQQSSSLQTGDNAFFKGFPGSNNSSPTTAGGTLVTSPNVLSFHSPQQFLNAPGNFLSPQDLVSGGSGGGAGAASNNNGVNANNSEVILHDFSSDVMGIVPKVPLPSFNSPTRLGMKIGYLLKELTSKCSGYYGCQKSYLVYEVNLLSCSNYWDLESLMKLILNHYKKLIVLNDILGLRKIDGNIVPHDSNIGDSDGTYEETEAKEILDYEARGIVPWHIAAVGKSLDYLLHVYVEE